VASVIAGFLKDRISMLLSHFSEKFRAWSTRRKIQQEELINILANNQGYLTLALLRVIFSAVMFIGSTILFFLMPIYAEIKQPSLNPEVSTVMKSILTISVYPFFGGLSMGFGFRTTSGVNVVFKAIKQYRIQNQLPKLP
jgi:hypothetical protein